MFWKSVLDALLMLTYWEFYVAGIIYLAFMMIPGITLMILREKGNTIKFAFSWYGELFETLFHILGLIIFLSILAPIIFGFSRNAAWTFPWVFIVKEPMIFLLVFLSLLFADFVYGKIPVIWQIESPRILILGGITFIWLVVLVKRAFPGLNIDNVHFIPSLIEIIGFLFLSFVSQILSFITISLIHSRSSNIAASEESNEPLIYINYAVYSTLPVLIYGAWLGNQITQS